FADYAAIRIRARAARRPGRRRYSWVAVDRLVQAGAFGTDIAQRQADVVGQFALKLERKLFRQRSTEILRDDRPHQDIWIGNRGRFPCADRIDDGTRVGDESGGVGWAGVGKHQGERTGNIQRDVGVSRVVGARVTAASDQFAVTGHRTEEPRPTSQAVI